MGPIGLKKICLTFFAGLLMALPCAAQTRLSANDFNVISPTPDPFNGANQRKQETYTQKAAPHRPTTADAPPHRPSFEDIRGNAIRDNIPLIMFVGVSCQAMSDAITVELLPGQIPGVSGNAVVVSVPHNGTLIWDENRKQLPASATPDQIRAQIASLRNSVNPQTRSQYPVTQAQPSYQYQAPMLTYPSYQMPTTSMYGYGSSYGGYGYGNSYFTAPSYTSSYGSSGGGSC